jgi:hypothetical protein
MKKQSPIEVLRSAEQIVDADVRAEYVRTRMGPGLKMILTCVFNPDVNFDESLYTLPYKSHRKRRTPKGEDHYFFRIGEGDTSFDVASRTFYIFTNDCPVKLLTKQRKFVSILGDLHPDESVFLQTSVIQKTLPFRKINKAFIGKYFPEFVTAKISK